MKTYKVPEVSLYGVDILDDQHQRLFDIIEEFDTFGTGRDRQEIEDLFDRLSRLLVDHFSDEERLMVETRYSRVGEHRQLHQDLIFDVGRIKERVSGKGEMSRQDANESIDRIIRHKLLADGPFNTHLKSIGYRPPRRKRSSPAPPADADGAVTRA